MIERPMPQDIMKFKAKLMFGLTARQILWGCIGCVVALSAFFIIGDAMPSKTKIIVCALCASPFLALGFVTIMDMPLEKIIVPYLIDNFIAPSVRKKEIHNPEYEKFRKSHYGEYEAETKEPTAEESQDKKKGKNTKKQKAYKCLKSKEYIGIK